MVPARSLATIVVALLAGCAAPVAPTPTTPAPTATTPAPTLPAPTVPTPTLATPTSPTSPPLPVSAAPRTPGHGILEGALEPVTPYGAPAPVTIGEGEGAFTMTAYPGLLSILALPTATPSDITTALAPLGGEIVAQVPKLGLYEARVAIGSETAALALLSAQPWFALGGPVVPVRTSAQSGTFTTQPVGAVSLTTDIVSIDDEATPLPGCTGMTHGEAMRSVMETSLAESPAGPPTAGGALLLDGPFVPALTSGGGVARQVAAIAQAAADADQRTVIAIPLQAAGGTRAEEAAFLGSVLWAIEQMPAEVRDHILVVEGLGNGGLDLTMSVAFLRSAMPQADASVLLVGGALLRTESPVFVPDPAANRVTEPDAAILEFSHPATAVHGTSVCSVSGVSVAVARATATFARLLRDHPDLAPRDVVALVRARALAFDPTEEFPQGFHLVPAHVTLEEALQDAQDPTPPPAPEPEPTPAPDPKPFPYDTDKVRLVVGDTSCVIAWQRPPSDGSTEVQYEIRALGTVAGPPGTTFYTDAYAWDERGPSGDHIPSGTARMAWGGYGTYHTRAADQPIETDWEGVWDIHYVIFRPDGTAQDTHGVGTFHDKTTIDLVTTVSFDDHGGDYFIEPHTDHTTVSCPLP